MICQACGIEAPTKYVSFHQNIGALVMRFSKSISGNLCKSCIHKNFWGMTGTTAVLGWWGTISLIITPFILLNNMGRYAFCLTMAPPEPGALPPQLTEEAVERISPHAKHLFDRLNQEGAQFQPIAEEVANLARVTPAQVALYVRLVIDAQSEQQ